MLIYVEGNLIESDCDVIGHGCNCFNTMGSGIAREIREKLNDAWKIDQQTLYGDKNKLGTITYVDCEYNQKRLTVVNCYTQYKFGHIEVYADYDAIKSCMTLIKNTFSKNLKLGFPKIGAGLARGDWNIISKIIHDVFDDRDVYIFELNTTREIAGKTSWDLKKYKELYEQIYNTEKLDN